MGKNTNGLQTGVVKWFNAEKGYGFIQPEKGDDVFVHYSGIEGSGYRSLQQGDRVQFLLEESKQQEGRMVAAGVQVIT